MKHMTIATITINAIHTMTISIAIGNDVRIPMISTGEKHMNAEVSLWTFSYSFLERSLDLLEQKFLKLSVEMIWLQMLNEI